MINRKEKKNPINASPEDSKETKEKTPFVPHAT
jgi:hypothetical protein